jgi:hypothetical protein
VREVVKGDRDLDEALEGLTLRSLGALPHRFQDLMDLEE